MKPNILIIILVFSIFLFYGQNSYSETISPDEIYYKKCVGDLNKLLRGYFKNRIRVKKEKLYGNGKDQDPTGISFTPNQKDINNQELYFDNNKQIWIKLDQELNNFSKKFPESKWCDDASFYRVFEAIIAKYPSDYWATHLIEATKFFIDNYPTFNLENWTKNKFDEVIQLNYQDIVAFHGKSENEMIRATAYNMLIGQYCFNKEFSKAKTVLKQLKKENLSDPNFYPGLFEYVEFIKNKKL